jgi:hypothetical protein
MTEINYSHDRSRYAFQESREGAKHDILVTPHATLSHYTRPDFDHGSTLVHVTEALAQITVDHNGNAVLVFDAKDGGQLKVTLHTVTPEALCDAVEAARLQEVQS